MFDLEQKIMNCWGIVDDLVVSNESEYCKALAVVYDRKFKDMFEEFEKVAGEMAKLKREREGEQ